MTSTAFKIYNASAGAGKTFTLVREYLTLLLSSETPDTYRQILAITFTNKAVNEMKERVIDSLREMASEEILSEPSDMFLQLCESLKTAPETLHQRAGRVLKRILHNYAFFDISTIDKFNHRLLRTFAHDLQLPVNFEVALDTVSLLNEAVDRLVYKAGEDPVLTEVLVSYALEKADDDKSWDISLDLKKTARLLLQENHYEHIRQIESKSLSDLKQLSAVLKQQIGQTEKQLSENAKAFFDLLEENGIETTDFNRNLVPGFFEKAAGNSLKGTDLQGKKWQENISTDPLYTKTLEKKDPARAQLLDELQPHIATLFQTVSQLFFLKRFLENFRGKLIPLSLLSAINQELTAIKNSENLMLISEFNSILAEAVAHQPAPYIYERLGEKYRHYFIDEFQDTSEMQWNNLLPLIGSALEGETLTGKRGSLMLVGDAKQAIYRWRGGKAEQFIDLYNSNTAPFQVAQAVQPLPVNYRSYDRIIGFNNSFFKYISRFLSQDEYRDLYENKSYQEPNTKKGGTVSITFIDKNSDDLNEAYCRETLQKINSLTGAGYPLSAICVLTRKRSQGAMLATLLQENGIPVISSESLLLKNHPKVEFLVYLLHYLQQPDNRDVLLHLLEFLAEKEKTQDKHAYFSSGLENPGRVWKEHGFSPGIFRQRPLYDAIQYAISCFALNDPSDAYLQTFLDEVLNQVNRNHSSPSEFLEYWEKQKDSLAINAPDGAEAVQIMTIHKSKGLQFPVVLFPFADTNIYDDREPLLWFPIDREHYGIPYALVARNRELAAFSDRAADMVARYDAMLELDSFNLLYVALTRAVEQLHIIGKTDMDKSGRENLKSFSGLLISYLRSEGWWEDGKFSYQLTPGNTPYQPTDRSYRASGKTGIIPYFSNISAQARFRIITRSGSLWDAGRNDAIERGNIYHTLLSQVNHAGDIENTLVKTIAEGSIPASDKDRILIQLKAIVSHPDIAAYFRSPYIIHNERDIFTAGGELLRPDRIAINPDDHTAVILDYKTGSPDSKYERQVTRYMEVVGEMGYRITAGFIVFINDPVKIYRV
ncbi:UvrD-helicase domain-containing protein [Sinomicrobium soli]|uniref:UvrD-helicase domain-containing protein n=1 Tax=Sinomicrobium sp. N-1-3-6 TaxID=2219864 RepID=UPI000DCCD52B|nr:UvrD-helicase domain-containing protein [Sinomicrobium sp. N-1-3-6]RAV28503.1 exonuclease V subunit beta [Sinomicrobium sp. N-1-3-6]